MLKKEQFDKAVKYLTELEKFTKKLNDKYQIRDNEMIFYHVYDDDTPFRINPDTLISYQITRNFDYGCIEDKVWCLNVYTDEYIDNTVKQTVVRYNASNIDELWSNYVNGKARNQEVQNLQG